MSDSNEETIVIVSGLPRSGTSMMMRMLEAGGIPVLVDNIRRADDDNPRGYYEFEPVKKTKEDASWLEQAGGRVVKMVYRLLYDLPADRDYDVVFMRRHLSQVIKSQDVMLDRLGRKGGDMSADKLLQLFEQQLAEFDKWFEAQSNFRRIDISYNDVLDDPAPAVAALSEFFGGRLNTAAMLEVVEPQLYRQRGES